MFYRIMSDVHTVLLSVAIVEDLELFHDNNRQYRYVYDRIRVKHAAGRPNHEQSTTITAILKVKPEAATAVIELLMVGGKTPETC